MAVSNANRMRPVDDPDKVDFPDPFWWRDGRGKNAADSPCSALAWAAGIG
jgi:hypothetical protein